MHANNTSLTPQESSLDADCGTNQFESDDCGDHDDAHPVQVHRVGMTESMPGNTTVPGAYVTVGDHNYDRPPFGSPLATVSSPNLQISDANRDEELPSPVFMTSRLLYTAGALIPTHYVRVPTNGPEGKENVVPSNAAVRPAPSVEIEAEDSNSGILPGETQSAPPPCYATVQTGAVLPCSDATTALGRRIPILTDSDARISMADSYLGFTYCLYFSTWMSFFWGIFGFFIVRLFPWRASKLGSIIGLVVMLLYYSTYSPTATDAQVAVTDNKLPTGGNDTTTDDPVRTSSSIVGEILDAGYQWNTLSFLIGAVGFMSLFDFWVWDGWCRHEHDFLGISAYKAPPEEHEHTSPGSEPLAGPTAQEVEYAEAANPPAGV